MDSSQIIILEQTKQLKALLTIIRDKQTQRNDFIFYSDRVIRLLVEQGNSIIITDLIRIESFTRS